MAEQKIFVGSGKKKNENWLSITVNPDKLAEHIKEYNGNKFVKLNINIGKPDKYGKDVQVTVDTWEPKKEEKTFTKGEDLPF
jgi:hypothetical protein